LHVCGLLWPCTGESNGKPEIDSGFGKNFDARTLSRRWSGNDRPHFDRPETRARNALCNGEGLVHIFGFDQEESAQLFFGFGKGAVRDQAFAVAQPQGCRFRRKVEAVSASMPATGGKALRKIHIIGENLALFGLGHFVPLVFVGVDQQQILHGSGLLLGCFNRPSWESRTAASFSTGVARTILHWVLPQVSMM
jgi:hypothetical protein